MYVCNVTSLVHSYIVITVFPGLVSGLLSVHYGAFSSFSIRVPIRPHTL